MNSPILANPRSLLALFLAMVRALVSSLPVTSTAGSPAVADGDAEPPSKPTGLQVATQEGSLDVSVDWDDVDGATMGSTTFNWIEDTPVYHKTTVSAPEYVLVDGDDDDADITLTARLLDQYGEGIRTDPNGNAYRITLTLGGNGSEHFTDIDPDTPGVQTTSDVVKRPGIASGSSSRGTVSASFTVNDIATTTHRLVVAYQIAQAVVDSEGVLVDGDAGRAGVQISYQGLTATAASGTAGTAVYVAANDSHGNSKQVTVHRTFGGDTAGRTPATHFTTEGDGSHHGVLYAIDDNDTYNIDGETAPPCRAFRPRAGDMVTVITYSTDSGKASIYDIIPSLTHAPDTQGKG